MRRILLPLAVVGLVAGSVGPWHATADEGTATANHGHGAHAASSPEAGSPYADRFDPAAAIRSLTPETIAQIERGEGAGFALPAELNGVPGPRHVLDMAHDLELSHDQVERVQAVYDDMRAAVIPAGRRYLDAVRALEADFRAGALTEADLPRRVAEVARLEGELMAAHLAAHLATADILRPEQIAAYSRLRGYLSGTPQPVTPAP